MIDFTKDALFILETYDFKTALKRVTPMLIEGEEVFATFCFSKDNVIFTTKRVIIIKERLNNTLKKDFTSLPYNKVKAFSVETAGDPGLDCELDLWFSGLGKIRFEFKGNFDILGFNKMIGEYIL
ncbi:MAG: PH domain-containing protein [Erysipelotrichaceae bacterium]|jgi:hypothetical protein|nr:PH domain-containing protein [Erysipelotrichaceae bacterium]